MFTRFVKSLAARLAIFLIGAIIPLAAVDAQEAASPAMWISADAIAYLEVAHPDALLDRLESPEVRGLLDAMPSIRDALEGQDFRQFLAVAEVVAIQLDTTVLEGVRDLTSGGVVLAFEGESGPERIYLIVTPTKVESLEKAHAALLRLARADAKGKGAPDPVTEAEHRGFKTYSVSPQEAHAIVDGRLIVANGTGPLNGLIDRIEGQSGEEFRPIARNDAWKSSRSAAGSDALAFAFGRLDRIRALDPNSYNVEEPDQGAMFLLGSWYESLLKSEWITATISWTGEELAAELTIPAPPGGYDEPAARFRPESGAGASPNLTTTGAIVSASLWRDFSAIWEVRDQIFRGETLQGLAQLDGVAGQFFGGRDFGTGVLGSLGNSQRLVIANQDYEALDPSPDLKLPGFAMAVGLDPNDPEFAVRLKSAFQSFVGIVNLNPEQTGPPLMLGSESVDGVAVSTSKYLPPNRAKGTKPDEGPVDTRYNFTPTAVEVDSTFMLGSAKGVVLDLIPPLRSEDQPEPTDYTLIVEADGEQAARLVEVNRERLAMQNMLEEGNSREVALARIDLLARLARYLGRGRLTVEDREDRSVAKLKFQLGSADADH